MLAEFAVLEEEGVVKLPEHLSLEEGATLPCAGVTAWDAIMNHAKLVAGTNGAVARHRRRLDLRRAIGARHGHRRHHHLVERREACPRQSLGAAFGINYKTTPEWDKAARDFTGGRGVDHVLEVGGVATLTRSFGAIRHGGKISIIGSVSGGATELNPGLIFSKRANVQGISVGSMQSFEAMNAAIAASKIKPAIDRVFGFDEVKAAFNHMAAGAHFGKIVIRVGVRPATLRQVIARPPASAGMRPQ